MQCFSLRLSGRLLGGALALMASAGLSVSAQAASAGNYPAQPLQVIIPNPPGGGTDTLGRLILNAAAVETGWNIVTLNRPGAAGAVGLEQAARAEPDGYTIVLGETSNIAINPALYKALRYDPIKDFVPVLSVGSVPLVMVVPADSPYKTAEEFIEGARKEKLVMGSAGSGTVGHLAGAMMQDAAKIELLHVPYKGASPALNDLVGGRVSVFFGSAPSVRSYIASGKVRALAVSSAERAKLMPNVPTLAESGLKGFDAVVWYGFLAPAGTRPAHIDSLAEALGRTLQAPAMRERLGEDGMTVELLRGDQFASFISQEKQKWGRVVESAGVQVD